MIPSAVPTNLGTLFQVSIGIFTHSSPLPPRPTLAPPKGLHRQRGLVFTQGVWPVCGGKPRLTKKKLKSFSMEYPNPLIRAREIKIWILFPREVFFPQRFLTFDFVFGLFVENVAWFWVFFSPNFARGHVKRNIPTPWNYDLTLTLFGAEFSFKCPRDYFWVFWYELGLVWVENSLFLAIFAYPSCFSNFFTEIVGILSRKIFSLHQIWIQCKIWVVWAHIRIGWKYFFSTAVVLGK